MSKWIQAFLSLTLTFVTSTTLASSDSFSIGTWHTSGLQNWQTIFPLHTKVIDGASELNYPHEDNYLVASFDKKLAKHQSLQFELGMTTSPITKIGTDSDWDYSKNNNLWYFGTFETQNKGLFLTIDWKKCLTKHTNLLAGYHYNRNLYSMKNGFYSIEDYANVNVPLVNLDSKYLMIYQGPHFGIQHTIPLTNTIALIGSFIYSPLLLAQGQGWWNLRDLSFAHTGTARMFDTKIGLQFAINSASVFSLGYRYQNFSLYNGRENTNPDIVWNKALNVQQGYYMTGTRSF